MNKGQQCLCYGLILNGVGYFMRKYNIGPDFLGVIISVLALGSLFYGIYSESNNLLKHKN